MNPLRHARADGDDGAPDSGVVPESTSVSAGAQSHRGPKSVAVSRLQRVLSAQQPVASKRASGGSETVTPGGSD
jgi:hypothetical protein